MLGSGWAGQVGGTATVSSLRASGLTAGRERFCAFTALNEAPPTNTSNGVQTGATYASGNLALFDVTAVKCLFGNGLAVSDGRFIGNDGAAATMTLHAGFVAFNNLTHQLPTGQAGNSLSLDPGDIGWTGYGTVSSNSLTYLAKGSAINLNVYVSVPSGKKWYYTRPQNGTDNGGTDAVMHNGGAGSGLDTVGNLWAGGSWQGTRGSSFSQFDALAMVGVQLAPKPVAAAIGNSIAAGFGATNFNGWIPKAINLAGSAAVFGYNGGVSGSTTDSLNNYEAINPTLIQYADYWISQTLDNDWVVPETLANMKAQILSQAHTYSLGGTRRYVIATATPRTTSTDGHTTVGNQTVVANESNRQAINAWLRDTTATGAKAQSNGDIWLVYDAAAQVEASAAAPTVLTPGGGLWYCGPGNNTAYVVTASPGIHPNDTGCTQIAAAFPAASLVLF